MAFLVNLGQAMQAYSVPCWLVGWWLWRPGFISQDTYLLYDKDSLGIKKKIDVECFQDFDVNLEN